MRRALTDSSQHRTGRAGSGSGEQHEPRKDAETGVGGGKTGVRFHSAGLYALAGDAHHQRTGSGRYCLIPVQAQYLSAKGLEQLLQTVQKVRRQINPKLKIEGILLTMTDSRTNYGKQISNLIRQAYGKHLKVFEPTIPRSVRAAETSAAGKSIFQHDPKGKVAEAYQSLAKEVLADADRQRKLSSERAR